jgi:amidase
VRPPTYSSLLVPSNVSSVEQDGLKDLDAILKPYNEGPLHSLTSDHEKSVYELYQLNREKEHYQQLFLQRWLETAKKTETGRPIDGLICPATAKVACKPGNFRHVGYTMCAQSFADPSRTLTLDAGCSTVWIRPA